MRPFVVALAYFLAAFTVGPAFANTISGTITDEFANPIANIQVMLLGNNNYFTTYTDQNGDYQFADIEGDHRYTVAPNKYEYMPVVDNSQVNGATLVETAEDELGNTDGQDPGRYHGHGNDWCSEFVSWVYWQSGEPFTGGADDGGDCDQEWNMSAGYKVVAGFGRNGLWQYLSIDEIDANWPGGEEFPLEPQPGDYIFFSNETGIDRAHSGMVDEIVGTDMHTIEGNISGGIVDTTIRFNWRTNQSGNTIVKGIGYRRLVSQVTFAPEFAQFWLDADQNADFVQFRHCKGDAHIAPPMTVAEGMAMTPDNGVLSIVKGHYNEALTITRPMEIRACPGPVVIGVP